MPMVVRVSSIEQDQNLMEVLKEYFQKGQYAEITQAIGMHSLLIDSEHARNDQARLYRAVLTMLKHRIETKLGKEFGAWYTDFPNLMDKIITEGEGAKNSSTAAVLSSHREAYGPFHSVDDFFFWALDDRKLTLEQIVKYIEKTAENRHA